MADDERSASSVGDWIHLAFSLKATFPCRPTSFSHVFCFYFPRCLLLSRYLVTDARLLVLVSRHARYTSVPSRGISYVSVSYNVAYFHWRLVDLNSSLYHERPQISPHRPPRSPGPSYESRYLLLWSQHMTYSLKGRTTSQDTTRRNIALFVSFSPTIPLNHYVTFASDVSFLLVHPLRFLWLVLCVNLTTYPDPSRYFKLATISGNNINNDLLDWLDFLAIWRQHLWQSSSFLLAWIPLVLFYPCSCAVALYLWIYSVGNISQLPLCFHGQSYSLVLYFGLNILADGVSRENGGWGWVMRVSVTRCVPRGNGTDLYVGLRDKYLCWSHMRLTGKLTRANLLWKVGTHLSPGWVSTLRNSESVLQR